jgi:hypothetical protein
VLPHRPPVDDDEQRARPFVSVRQRMRRRKGEGLVTGSLKSRYARRDLPIPDDLADRLRALGAGDREPVFTTRTGRPLDPDPAARSVACRGMDISAAGRIY